MNKEITITNIEIQNTVIEPRISKNFVDHTIYEKYCIEAI